MNWRPGRYEDPIRDCDICADAVILGYRCDVPEAVLCVDCYRPVTRTAWHYAGIQVRIAALKADAANQFTNTGRDRWVKINDLLEAVERQLARKDDD